jgi:hypothetical protein
LRCFRYFHCINQLIALSFATDLLNLWIRNDVVVLLIECMIFALFFQRINVLY